MQDKMSIKTINKLIYIAVLTLIICLIFVVSKYIGLNLLIGKIINSFIPVLIAVFFSFIIEPIIGFFLKKGIKRRYSVLLTYGLIIIIVAFIFVFTIPSLIDQVEIFVSNIPVLIEMIESFVSRFGINVGQDVGNTVKSIFINFSSSIIKSLSSSLEIVYNILLGISGAVFLSFDFPKFRSSFKKYIPNRLKAPIIYYFKHFLPFVHKYFLGMLIDSILIFIISILGFSIIGIEYTLVISLFIAVTNLIPIVGPYIGGVPAVIIGFSVSPTLGVSALVVVVLVQIIESIFLQPIILKNVIALHPLEGILGISLFGSLFGVIGMILSPILIVAIKLLFSPYEPKKEIQEII